MCCKKGGFAKCFLVVHRAAAADMSHYNVDVVETSSDGVPGGHVDGVKK